MTEQWSVGPETLIGIIDSHRHTVFAAARSCCGRIRNESTSGFCRTLTRHHEHGFDLASFANVGSTVGHSFTSRSHRNARFKNSERTGAPSLLFLAGVDTDTEGPCEKVGADDDCIHFITLFLSR